MIVAWGWKAGGSAPRAQRAVGIDRCKLYFVQDVAVLSANDVKIAVMRDRCMAVASGCKTGCRTPAAHSAVSIDRSKLYIVEVDGAIVAPDDVKIAVVGNRC